MWYDNSAGQYFWYQPHAIFFIRSFVEHNRDRHSTCAPCEKREKNVLPHEIKLEDFIMHVFS